MKSMTSKYHKNFQSRTLNIFFNTINRIQMKSIKHYTLFFLLIIISSCSNDQEKALVETQTSEMELPDNQISVSLDQFKMNNMHLVKAEEHNFPNSITVNGMIDVPPRYKAVVYATMK